MTNITEVYNQYHKMVLSYLIRSINDNMVAEELANDVFIKANRYEYDAEKSAVKTWILWITRNILIDYFRKKKLATTSINQNDDGTHINSGDFILGVTSIKHRNNPHIELVSKEKMIEIQLAIVGLPKKYKRICNLFFNHQYMMKDISIKTNKPLNTIKGDIHKARKLLQKQLINNYG